MIPTRTAPLDLAGAQRRYLKLLDIDKSCDGCGALESEVVLPAFGPSSPPARLCAGCKARLEWPKGEQSLVCVQCGSKDGVALESSRTAYVKTCTVKGCFAGLGLEGLEGHACVCKHEKFTDCPNWPTENPNAPIPLCRACAKDHHSHWDEMWREYRASQR